MPAPVLILPPRVTEDSVSIWHSAISEGWSTLRLRNWRAPEELLLSGREKLIYGEPLFAEAVADQLGIVLFEPVTTWLPSLPHSVLRRRVHLCKLSHVHEYGMPIFVKPAEGKVFEPRVVYEPGELPKIEKIDDLDVLVSDPVRFDLEVRFFVSSRRPICSSPYWRHGKLARDESGEWPFLGTEEREATSFLEELLKNSAVELPPSVVIDIGRIENDGWAVIEANPLWGAGLYGCASHRALRQILNALRQSMKPRANASPEELHWVSKRAPVLE